MSDISKYLGNAFLKVSDVKEAKTIRVTITDVSEGKYEKPDLSFDDGTRLSCNVTNCRTLARSYGTESDDWIGKEIELVVGEVEFNNNMQEAILINPISPPIKKKPPKPKMGQGGDMDDEIAF